MDHKVRQDRQVLRVHLVLKGPPALVAVLVLPAALEVQVASEPLELSVLPELAACLERLELRDYPEQQGTRDNREEAALPVPLDQEEAQALQVFQVLADPRVQQGLEVQQVLQVQQELPGLQVHLEVLDRPG